MRIEATKRLVIAILICSLTARANAQEITSKQMAGQQQEPVKSNAVNKNDSRVQSFEKVSRIIMKQCSYPHRWENISFVNSDCSQNQKITMLVSSGGFWYDGYLKEVSGAYEKGSQASSSVGPNSIYADELVSRLTAAENKAFSKLKKDGKIFDSSSISWEFRKLDDFKFSDRPDVKSDSREYWCKQNIQNDMNVKKNQKFDSDEKLIESININQRPMEHQPASFEKEEKSSRHDDAGNVMSGFTCDYSLGQSVFIVLSIIGFGLIQNRD